MALTRKDMKTDRFAVAVEHQIEYVAAHRSLMVRWGAIALAVVLVGLGIYFYRAHQRTVREERLADAIQIQEAPVGAAQPGVKTFDTEEAKRAEVVKAFTAIVTEYPGTTEGYIAQNFLGAIAADQGKMDEARKRFQSVADSADKNFASLAKVSLAQIDFAESRTAEGEKLLRDLMEHPTDLVSREQATIVLARAIGKTKPAEARRLLEPLKTGAGGVSQAAVSALSELPGQ